MNEHLIPTVILEDSAAAAQSFANAKRVEDSVRATSPGTLVFTNFTGSLTTGVSAEETDRPRRKGAGRRR